MEVFISFRVYLRQHLADLEKKSRKKEKKMIYEEIMLQAPTCIWKNSLIIQTEHALHVNAERRKKTRWKVPASVT